MQFFRASRVLALTALMVVAQVLVAPVWADPPTDSGTITVTGSVAPKGASITTSLAVAPASTTFAQDETAEYILRYSSAAVGSFPLTLQAEWGKGTITGATEPTVDVVTYVVGSATMGYGDTVPVINTTLRTITWEIPSLPGGSGTHEVRFKLKTTNSYTGSLLVQFPVILKVLLPTGATDRVIQVPYRYAVPTTSSESVSPTVTPTTAPNSTPTPIPNSFESVLIRSTGKTSARIAVATALPSQVTLSVGTSPQNLGMSVSSLKSNTEHLLFLENLTPGTNYYFQVSLLTATGSIQSDVFAFTTAQRTAIDVTRKPIAVTFSQQRSVLFSGPTATENGDDTKPISVVKNSVLDLSLVIPQAQELKQVEVLVRPAGVLGSTTEQFDTDDLQSTTTVMTQIADTVFVGKLRMPVQPGNYRVISRIEDWQGNLSEEKIGSLKIAQPFTITELGTGRPLFGARVELKIYNQLTKLYETVSNVSTSIPNPAFADAAGELVLPLPPARYQATISLPGYETQSLEFTVDGQSEIQYPQLQLKPIVSFLARSLDYSARQLQTEWQRWLSQWQDFVRSPQLFTTALIAQILMLFGLGVLLQLRSAPVFAPQRNSKKLGRVLVVLQFGLRAVVRYGFETALAFNLMLGAVMLQTALSRATVGFMALAMLNLCLWLRCLWVMTASKK